MNSQNGETPLHAAALFGHAKVARELIDNGAQPDMKNKVADAFSLGQPSLLFNLDSK